MTLAVLGEDLHKAYVDGERRVEVLRGVDLEVATGEMVAISGPSGSGKSTLLHVLGGLDLAERGRVEIAGCDLATLSRHELAGFRNQRVGFIFQFHELLPDFTAVENVMIPLRIAERPPTEARSRALELLEEVGLSARRDHFPNELSGGERQRVAICRALALRPPLLLADEPTGNLDLPTGRRVLGLLEELHRHYQMSLLVVTHNPEVADRCGRVLTLEDGVLRPADGP